MMAKAAEKKSRSGRKRKGAVSLAGPGYDGQRELVTEQIASPYDPERSEVVIRNPRHDPIEHLFAKGKIDIGQRLAGQRVRELVEALGLDAVRSIVMDGAGGGTGKRYEFPAHRIEAGRRMMGLREEIGRDMTALLIRVAGYGETITSVAIGLEDDDGARANGACSALVAKHVGWLLKRALSCAADHFGYGRARGLGSSRGIEAWLAEGARPHADATEGQGAGGGVAASDRF